MKYYAIVIIPEKISKSIRTVCYYGENGEKLDGISIDSLKHYPIQLFPIMPVEPNGSTSKSVDLQNLKDKLHQCQLIYGEQKC